MAETYFVSHHCEAIYAGTSGNVHPVSANNSSPKVTPESEEISGTTDSCISEKSSVEVLCNGRFVDKWRREATTALIAMWEENFDLLETLTTKKPIYTSISQKLGDLGFPKSPLQVQRKIQNLKDTYRKVKPKCTGDSTSSWEFFQEVHQLLKSKPFYNDETAHPVESTIVDHSSEILQPNEPDDETNEADDEPNEIDTGQSTTSVNRSNTESGYLQRKRRRLANVTNDFNAKALHIFESYEKHHEEDNKILQQLVDVQVKTSESIAGMVTAITSLATALASRASPEDNNAGTITRQYIDNIAERIINSLKAPPDRNLHL